MRIRKQPRQMPACQENAEKIALDFVSAPSVPESEVTVNVDDQLSKPGDEEEEAEDDNPTQRHYVRRGHRNGNPSIVDVLAAISKTNSYECDRFPYSEKKVNSYNRPNNGPRLAIPCESEDEEADHPSREPEGSLLHALYLQLLAAGREGISLRGLFASFESQTSLPRLASNWREQVKAHLKNGPYFEEVKGRYLLCEFLVQPSSKRAPKRKEGSENHGFQTRRKAYQKAGPSESVPLDFLKLQRQKIHDDEDSTKSRNSSPANRGTSKAGWSDELGLQMSGNIRFGGAIPGSLKAMQARIIAETGVQAGVRCARKDGSHDSSKWQCPMMAMEGHTLCEHHSFLNERKRARYAKARRQGDSRMSKSLQEKTSTPRSELHNSDSDDLAGLDEVASQALLTMKSDILAVDKPEFQPFEVDRSPVPVREEATTKAKSNLAPHFFARSPTGRFIAAKKTAVKLPAHSLETESSMGKFMPVTSTRPPSIPPLPAFYGPRRKIVKNRSLLSIS